jgi:hypothetical protein
MPNASTKLIATGALAFALVGCGDKTPQCDLNTTEPVPNFQTCSPVQVGYVDYANVIRARLDSTVRKDDGIAVNVQARGDSDMPLGPAITIVAKPGDQTSDVLVVAQDHWLPQADADAMLADAKQKQHDNIDRVVLLINDIHAWQDAHPRPAVTVTKAPAPQQKPVPQHTWLDTAIPIAKIIVKVLVFATLGALAYQVRKLVAHLFMGAARTWWTGCCLLYGDVRAVLRWLGRLARRRRDRREELARRAIEENKLVESNDSRGVFGPYTPIDLEKL